MKRRFKWFKKNGVGHIGPCRGDAAWREVTFYYYYLLYSHAKTHAIKETNLIKTYNIYKTCSRMLGIKRVQKNHQQQSPPAAPNREQLPRQPCTQHEWEPASRPAGTIKNPEHMPSPNHDHKRRTHEGSVRLVHAQLVRTSSTMKSRKLMRSMLATDAWGFSPTEVRFSQLNKLPYST